MQRKAENSKKRHHAAACCAGITNDDRDTSVDAIRAATLPLLRRFGVPLEEMELKILKRGCPPLGGGEIRLSLPTVTSLQVRPLTCETTCTCTCTVEDFKG